MRKFALSLLLLATSASPIFAQEAGGGGSGLMSLQLNLMFWTLVIFLILFFILAKYAFPPIIGAVQAREKALEDAIAGAKRDREAAAALLAEHQKRIEAARDEAQKLIAEGRAMAEKMRVDLIEQTHQEQQAMLQRAQQDIQHEKEKAIAQLRREAVELAIAGAGRVIEENLDTQKNRQLVETFLASIKPIAAHP